MTSSQNAGGTSARASGAGADERDRLRVERAMKDAGTVRIDEPGEHALEDELQTPEIDGRPARTRCGGRGRARHAGGRGVELGGEARRVAALLDDVDAI